MKAIHNSHVVISLSCTVVLYPKDTQKWKQFTTLKDASLSLEELCCIPKILKNESNSQPMEYTVSFNFSCVVSQRYSKMKAIHNCLSDFQFYSYVVLYPKDTQKWKQFTTVKNYKWFCRKLCCIPKILKNESNSQQCNLQSQIVRGCVVSQRYSKMKAIHNRWSI